MSIVSKLQTYLRWNEQQIAETIPLPPFTLFLRTGVASSDDHAIPDAPLGGDLEPALLRVRDACAARGRQPRIRFVAEFAPDLAPALLSAGFAEESSLALLVCVPESLRRPAALRGLTIQAQGVDAPLQDVRAGLDTNERGFDPEAAPVTEAQAVAFRSGLVESRAFLARLDGQAVGAGMFNPPFAGVTELAGITTLEAFRGRGVAANLTAYAARTAFERGVELVFLSTDNAIARRVYERLGFRHGASLRTYVLPKPAIALRPAE